jgi:hypothetical protein
MNKEVMDNRGISFEYRWFYVKKLNYLLCNVVDTENLHAVLRNESLDFVFVNRFIDELVEHS